MTQGPASPGTIGFLTVPALLGELLERRATGQLVATHGDVVKKILFKNGAVIYATSNLPADRLGDILLSRGMMSREHYEESSRVMRETGRKQGTVLVQIGALTPKDLFRGLIFQVREIVLSLFGWDEGRHEFVEGLPQQDEMVSLRIAASSLIFEGLVRFAGDERFRAAADPGRPGLRLRVEPSPPLLLDELECPVAARHLLALLEQAKPWAAIPAALALDEGAAAALLHGLVLLGFVSTVADEPDATPAGTAGPAPAAAPPPAEPDPETLRLRERVGTFFGHLAQMNHYEVFGLKPETDAETIKRAYIALAKEFHPDRFFLPALAGLQEQVNAIFMRVNEAYTTLQNPKSREVYDREVLRLVVPQRIGADVPQDSRVAQEQFKKGLALLNAGDLWSAVQSFRWAVNLNPQNPRYHTYLGVALTKTKKRLHEAEEHCKTAIALDYNNAQYYVHLGLVYKTGHLFEKARKQFEMALKLDPKHPQALRELAEIRSGG
jgi:tetratricopeptide (TPR) repeat protein